eukprot:gene4868-6088_t
MAKSQHSACPEIRSMDVSEPLGLGPLIASIYEAALDNGRWNAFLAGFAARLDSHAAMIWGHDFSDRSAEIDNSTGSIATFTGIEGQVRQRLNRNLGITLFGDTVRARLVGGGLLP